MGFLNGLSAAGAAVSNYAGALGLQYQKADLQNQSLQLADQLQGARESAGRQEAAGIAATAADKLQGFTAEQNALNRANSTNIAQINNAGLPEYRAAQTADLQQKTAAGGVELDKLQQLTGLQQQLANEQASPNPDPDKVNSLGNQIGALTTTAATRQAAQNALDSLAKTEAATSLSLSRQLNEETDKLGGITLDPQQRARQQQVVDDVKAQLDASRARAASLVEQARNATGTPRLAASSIINGPAPSTSASSSVTDPTATPSSSVSSSSVTGSATPSTGSSPFDAPMSGNSSTPPTASAPAPTTSGSATPNTPSVASATSGTLPGDVTGAKSLDDVKALRPELNVDALRGRNPTLVATVLSIVDGRASLPPVSARSSDALAIRSLANLVDPTLDEASVKGRMETRKAFSTGTPANNITALNTALGHAANLYDQFDKLNNLSFTPMNWLVNGIESKFGDSRITNSQMAINALASEARKVFAGASGGGSLTELKEWQDDFPLNGSPAQQKGALNQFVELLQSRMDSLSDQYNRGMGVTRDPTTFLEPKALAAYQKLTGINPTTTPARQLGNSTGFSPAPTTVPTPPLPAQGNDALRSIWGQ